MKVKPLISIVVPLVAFCATLADGLWANRNLAPAFVVPSPARPIATHDVAPVHPATPIASVRADAIPPSAPPVQEVVVASVEPTAPAEGETGDSLPLRFAARPGRGGPAIQASLLSLADENLEVTITASNATTGHSSILTVSIGPKERKDLTASGLELAPGDDVILRSLPYRDIHTHVL